MIFVAKLTKDYSELNNLKTMIVEDESKSLASFVVAFRDTYQKRFIQNHISINNKSVELLPVRTMGEISDKFSSLVGNRTAIRTVSDRPRNPLNKANDEEMQMISYFNDNKDKKTFFKSIGNGIYYYAQPLYIENACLKCHGKRKDAVGLIKKNYSDAYDYKLGELRGVLSIKIDKTNIIDKMDTSYFRSVQFSVLLYILFIFAIYQMLKKILRNQEAYESTLEEKVKEQVEELKSKEKKISDQSKLASMGEMIGNIAHQWRQPLSIISTGATAMKMKKENDILDDDEFLKTCSIINDNAQYLSQTIDDFKNFIKGDTTPVKFNLKKNVNSFIKLIDSTIKNKNLQVVLDLEEHIEINGYPNELIQCFMNIFNNSKDAFEENDISSNNRYVFISQKIEDNNVVIIFKDTANGIPDNIINKIFEPYFTTKHPSKGTGLGLHMTYDLIVNHMKGSIIVENEDFEFNDKQYKGAVFKIIFPIS